MQNTDKLEYHRDEHRVHLIVYHLIWCPRRRKPVLTGEIAERARQIILREVQRKRVDDSNPCHSARSCASVCAGLAPDSASLVVKEIKGVTAR